MVESNTEVLFSEAPRSKLTQYQLKHLQVTKNQGLLSKSIRGAETCHFGLILDIFDPV